MDKTFRRSSSSSSTSSSRLSPIPTTVYVNIPSDRNYSPILRQTEIVYDQLLADKERKLQEQIDEKQAEYLEKYQQLSKTDQTKASEFQRWSDAALGQFKDQCSNELRQLREDYEAKFVKLRINLEENWMAENRSKPLHDQQQHQHQQNHVRFRADLTNN